MDNYFAAAVHEAEADGLKKIRHKRVTEMLCEMVGAIKRNEDVGRK